jgi:hypothetical protein
MQVERFPGDVLGPDYHEVSIARNPIKIAGPLTTISDSHGLCVIVNLDVIEQHRLSE